MILQRVEHPDWLSNAYLVVDAPGGKGVLVDSNEVTEPLTERVDREGTEITHVLLTHHHWDHVVGAEKLAERYGVLLLAHELTAKELGDGVVTETFTEGDVIESGELRIEPIHTPGHCADHNALKLDDTDCLTADVIFKGTVGGTMAPGATGFEDLKASIMEKLMKLPPETRIHRATSSPRQSATSGSRIRSSASGAAWTRRGPTVARRPADSEQRREATLGPLGARLRRRQQGLGAIRRQRRGRGRRGLAGQARLDAGRADRPVPPRASGPTSSRT